MKKLVMGSMVMMLILVLATACSGSKAKTIDVGTTANGTYTNDYFGISLNFPTEWEFKNEEEMQELAEAGQELIAGDDASKKKKLDLASVKTLNLLVASKYPIGGEQVGPSIMSVAEKVSKLQGISSGKDYLEASKKLMVESQLPYQFKEITTVTVGGKEFHVMEVSIDTGAMVVTQNYYSRIIEGYAFNLITTYENEESKAETDKIIGSVAFKS